jgi:cytochrome c biogenesis protein
MKTGLYLLVAVSIASALGTLYPQGQVYTAWKRFLQLGDVYHSWWYITLLSLLALNLIACNISRIKPMINSLFHYQQLLDAKQVMKFKLNHSLHLSGDLERIKDQVINTLSGQGYQIWSQTDEDTVKIGAQKGRFYTLGSFITHLSFIIILLGALYGGLWGYKGYINVAVGSSFNLKQIPGITKNSTVDDFKIRVDKFWLERYADGTPSGYFSRLTIMEKDKVVKTATIAVNQPLEYRGVKFYQTSYGQLAQIEVFVPESKSHQELLGEGDIIRILGTDYHLLLYRYDPPTGMYSQLQAKELKIIYALYKEDKLAGTGKLGINQSVPVDEQGNSFKFTGFTPTTGLEVKKDPGVPVVIFGSLLIVLGIGMIMILKPHKIWAVLEKQDDSISISLGGNSRRHSLEFEEEFKKMVKELDTEYTAT